MQFSAIRTRCAVRFADASFAIITDATWKDYVNARYRAVSADSPYWPFLAQRSTSVSVTSETRSTILPTDAFRVQNVWDSTDKVKLEPLEGTAEHWRFWPDNTEDGVPVNYRVRNNSLEVYPLPLVTTTFIVEYAAPPSALSADADLPAFPSQYHDILVEGALADAYADDGNLKQYELHESRFQMLLARMRADLLETQTERYYQITDNFF